MEICSTRHLLGNLSSPDSACSFFLGLDFFRSIICEADLLIEIRFDELESLPAGLEDDVVKFHD